MLHGRPVVLVLSGIGKVAAATTVTTLAYEFAPIALLFTGVAGGLAPGVGSATSCSRAELLQHDLDASPLFPRYEVPLTGRAPSPPMPRCPGQRCAAGDRRSGALGAQPRGFGIVAPRLHGAW